MSYGAHDALPTLEPTSSTQFAERALDVPRPDWTVNGRVPYDVLGALPSPEPTFSTQFAEHALVDRRLDGSIAPTDGGAFNTLTSLEPTSLTQVADCTLGDSHAGRLVPFTDHVLHGERVVRPPLVQSTSSLSSALGDDGANLYGVPAFGRAVLLDTNGAFPAPVPSSLSRSTYRDLETDLSSTGKDFSDGGLMGGADSASSSHIAAHGALDMLDIPEGGFVFTASDLVGVDGLDCFVPTSSDLQDPGYENGLPVGASTFTDADFQAWLLAGTKVCVFCQSSAVYCPLTFIQIPNFDVDHCF